MPPMSDSPPAPAPIVPDWIAIDWGTSNLRVWAMSAADEPLAEAQSDRGMGKLTPDAFEPALLDLIRPWLHGPMTAIACGMVGARQGWTEAPYARTPCTPSPAGLTRAPATTPGLAVDIIPGVSQDHPADVMRGEETQIAGFLHLNPGWDGILCLPGTHTKWVHLSAGEIVSFQTVMTGELFATLSTQTVLRHSVGADGWDDAAFAESLADTLSRPERLAGRLFSLRANSLLHGQTPQTGRARLSGLLIGAELAATRPYWLGQQVAIVGAGTVARLYQTALAAQGAQAILADTTAVTLAGLIAARRRQKGHA
jgi:2-dehydro-3-deoxygalactonokinase